MSANRNNASSSDWGSQPQSRAAYNRETAQSGKSSRYRSKSGKGKRVGLIVAIVLGVLLISGGVYGSMLYKSAKTVMGDAKSALALVDDLKDQAMNGGDRLSSDAAQIRSLAQEMNDEVSTPLWTVATFVPVYGSDVSAAREMISVVNDLASEALVPVASTLTENPVKGLFADGAVNVASLQSLCMAFSDVAPVFHECNTRVQAIGSTHIDQLTEYVDKIKSTFEQADSLVSVAEDIVPVLPQMLGSESPRYYLLAAMNNAEIRALGGFTGAQGILTVDNGYISLGEFEGRQFAPDQENRLKITVSDEEITLFQPEHWTLDYTSGDSTMVPDFPRASELLYTLWQENHPDQQIDGVVALDPVFLQYLLQLTGGVTADDGTVVDGTNATTALISDVYWKYSDEEVSEASDAFFSSVASAAFNQVLGNLGSVDTKKLYQTIKKSISEGRLLVWMANEQEEAVFKTIGADGALSNDPADPETGIYVNNYSYSKLDYYLNLNYQIGEGIKNADGSISYNMTVVLANAMSSEEAANLPSYVMGRGTFIDSPDQIVLRLYLYAPSGGSISNVTTSSDQEVFDATHNGLQVSCQMVKMRAGESTTVTYTVTVPAVGAANDLKVRITPTAQEAREGTASGTSE